MGEREQEFPTYLRKLVSKQERDSKREMREIEREREGDDDLRFVHAVNLLDPSALDTSV